MRFGSLRQSVVSALLLVSSLGSNAAATSSYSNDVQVTLTNKYPILFDTNGAGGLDISFGRIYFYEGLYRWIGVSVSCLNSTVTNSLTGGCGLRSYTSVDLMTWNDAGIFASYSDPAFLAVQGSLSRPHLIYNAKTKLYVLWANAEGGYFTWTSTSPTGPWTLKGRVATPGFSGDFTVNIIAGSAYLVRSAFNFAKGGFIWPPFDQSYALQELTADYTNVTSATYTIRSAANDEVDKSTEAPNMFARNGYYYVTGSTTCGNCADAPLLVYRTKNITSGIWTRQIISGDTCGGQTTGVTAIKDSAGDFTYLHGEDLFRGYGPLSLHGKGNQVLSFNSDGSIQDLNCSPNASFTFKAIRGTGAVNNGTSASFTDFSDPNAVYEPTCDLNEYNIYQTWQNSKSGTLKEIGINFGALTPTSNFFIAILRFTSNQQFFTPSETFSVLYNETLTYNQTFNGLGLLKLAPNVAVKSGDRLAISIQGIPGNPIGAGNYCYLSKPATGAFNVQTSTRTLFYNAIGDTSPRGISGTEPPVKVRAREISWHSIVV